MVHQVTDVVLLFFLTQLCNIHIPNKVLSQNVALEFLSVSIETPDVLKIPNSPDEIKTKMTIH